MWDLAQRKPSGAPLITGVGEKHAVRESDPQGRDEMAWLAISTVASRILWKTEVVNTMQRLGRELECVAGLVFTSWPHSRGENMNMTVVTVSVLGSMTRCPKFGKAVHFP